MYTNKNKDKTQRYTTLFSRNLQSISANGEARVRKVRVPCQLGRGGLPVVVFFDVGGYIDVAAAPESVVPGCTGIAYNRSIL